MNIVMRHCCFILASIYKNTHLAKVSETLKLVIEPVSLISYLKLFIDMACNLHHTMYRRIRTLSKLNYVQGHKDEIPSHNCHRYMSSVPNEYAEPKEISIPVPWGHLAGRQWGNSQSGKPILALHGYLDNAASMNGLLPLLPLAEYNIVAIDLPGHGFSSHLAPGMTYRISDAMVAIRRIQLHLGWEKSHIIAHSMGAAIAAWFAATFQENVDRLALIDLISVGPTSLQKQVKTTKKSIQKNIDMNDKLANAKEPPSYTFVDACGRAFLANQFIHGTDSISRSSVETMMSRGLKNVGVNKNGEDLFTWTTDLRLRIPTPFNVVPEQAEHYAENVQCPLLIIKASDSPWYMSEEHAEKILKVYSNNNPNFVFKKVEGGHHVHLNEPEKVAPLINRFLKKQFKDSGTEDKQNIPFN